jgi:sRNA-binding regulator protein Hfq
MDISRESRLPYRADIQKMTLRTGDSGTKAPHLTCVVSKNTFMANSSPIPSGNLHELRPGFSQEHANGRLRALTPETSGNRDEAPSPTAAAANGNLIGPRKLVRPKLPAGVLRERSFVSRSESPILTHQRAAPSHDSHCSSHAEAFYFQKQVQTQTLMVFVLEDGEQVRGYIEWYDSDVIKVRNGSRTMIYKSAIKYLYKAGDIPTPFNNAGRPR